MHNRGRHAAGEQRVVVEQRIIAGGQRDIDPRFQIAQPAQLANHSPTDFLDHLYNVGIAGRLALDKAHLQAGGGRFRGIRHSTALDPSGFLVNPRGNPPAQLYLDAAFRRGFAQLARYEMSFEGWCYHLQIPELTDLAQAFPDTTIILNHFGGPIGVGPYADQREAICQQWCQDITALARCENMVAKLGGINMALNGFGWHERDRPPTSEELMLATRRYYDHALQQFGVERCMFKSNYPVDKESCSYNVLWHSFKRLTAAFSDDEKAALYHTTPQHGCIAWGDRSR